MLYANSARCRFLCVHVNNLDIECKSYLQVYSASSQGKQDRTCEMKHIALQHMRCIQHYVKSLRILNSLGNFRGRCLFPSDLAVAASVGITERTSIIRRRCLETRGKQKGCLWSEQYAIRRCVGFTFNTARCLCLLT